MIVAINVEVRGNIRAKITKLMYTFILFYLLLNIIMTYLEYVVFFTTVTKKPISIYDISL